VGTGTVVRFDDARGFGFIEQDDGGQDLFVHASEVECAEQALVRGARVGYQAVQSSRGTRAVRVHVLQPSSQRSAVPSPEPTSVASTATAVDMPIAQRATAPPSAGRASKSPVNPAADEDTMCDFLSMAQYNEEVTNVLLNSAPDLTAAQIVQIRSRLTESAGRHGWIGE
jgi:CspA family cold shock protein